MIFSELFEAITRYHGTSTPDAEFGPVHTGNNSHTFGAYTSTRYGIFFSNNPRFAAIYGTVGKYKLNLKDTLDMDKAPDVWDDFKKSIDPFDDRDFWLELRYGVKETWHRFENDVGKRWVKYLLQQGYDSAKFVEYNDKDGKEIKSETIVVFNPNSIVKI